jgi:hypothetical protein
MVSSGANVIIWCYHVMLSSGMITHPFFIFPENFTHSICLTAFSMSSYIQMASITIFSVLLQNVASRNVNVT